jgi:hypothetical protein
LVELTPAAAGLPSTKLELMFVEKSVNAFSGVPAKVIWTEV